MTETLFGFEIDFLPVGSGDKSGDAIVVRYGTVNNYKIMVIDGGTKESGEALVSHIKKYYNSTHVDYVVNTHPDGDHASGLSKILENFTVGELWMHRPWEYSKIIKDYFKDGRITDNSLAERLKDKMSAAYRLEELAIENDITLKEPFEGEKIGLFTVMSPSKDYYLELIPQFGKSPEAKKSALESASVFKAAMSGAQALVARVKSFIDETWDIETLAEDGVTSAENNSSVILYGYLAGKGILFTGDSGIESLDKAIDYAQAQGIDFTQNYFTQVPHHGSRNNISPSVLTRLVGGKVPKDFVSTRMGFVSASKDSSKHPKKVVMNAFKRRGIKIYTQVGQTISQGNNMPERSGWTSLTPIEFYDEVED